MAARLNSTSPDSTSPDIPFVPHSDEVSRLGRALDAVGELISRVRSEQWAAPTPCAEWTVQRLVSHLIGMNRVFAALLADEPESRSEPGAVVDDPVRGYRESAVALLAAFDEPDVLSRTYRGPLGVATGAERLQIRLYDLLVHGWDLSRAIGEPARVPDDLAERSLAFVRTQLTEHARPGRFAPAQSVPDRAPAIERLAGFLGRPITTTASFDGADGTRLAYHRTGAGRPLVWLPGGPMQASAYLGDLGGLIWREPTVLLDLRGTGDSAAPADSDSYRCDQQVADVEALRRHLGLDRLDLAGHSAGATLALLYAARYPERVARLILVTPSPRPVGLEVSDADRRRIADQRRNEPWFADAYAAFERIWAGTPTAADWAGIVPFTYGRWDAATQSHQARQAEQQNTEAAGRYYASDAFDPALVRSAVRRLDAPVLLLAGECDVSLPPDRAVEYAGLFRDAETIVVPGGGHFPWLDDADHFSAAVAGFRR